MLENLMYLSLSFANFYGEIPHHLGNLSRLQAENLDWLSSLSSLKFLDMGRLNLSSVGAKRLHAINMIPSLLELYLDLCDLESFPPSFPFVNFTSLFFLDLSSNNFNTTIPQWLFNLTSLTKLDLSYNALHGTISYDFVNLRNLEHLDSQDQYIGGQLPKLFWKFL